MIPPKPLELTLPADADDLRVNDLELLEPGGFSIRGFRQFMAAYSNWSAAQVGQLTRGEMREVLRQIIAKIEAYTLPKANGARS